jgi:hypothetical protein
MGKAARTSDLAYVLNDDDVFVLAPFIVTPILESRRSNSMQAYTGLANRTLQERRNNYSLKRQRHAPQLCGHSLHVTEGKVGSQVKFILCLSTGQ